MLGYSFIGLFLILGASFARRTRDKFEDVCVAVAAPIFLLLLGPLGTLTGHLRPVTMDAALRLVDLRMGLDGFALSRYCADHHWAYLIMEPVYLALPLVLAAAWVLTKSKVLLRACVIGAVLAFPFYLLVPAAGPAFTFTGWPWGDSGLYQPAMNYPRNCFPSMHLTWALLVAVNVKGYWRWLFGIYAGLMAVATVASGQHYVIDAIAAVPFTLAVQYVATYQFTLVREAIHERG